MAKSALRVLEILLLVAEQRDGCTHTDVSRALDIPKSSVTVLLRDMVSMGFLEVNEASGRYRIGAMALTLGHAYLKNLNLVQIAQPVVTELFLQTGEFVALAIPKGRDCVIVCAESPHGPLAHSLQIGERTAMLPSASGKSILAYRESDAIDAFLDAEPLQLYTEHTVVDKRRIRKELAEVRATGLAYSHGEAIAGITAIASPVFNMQGASIASISIAMVTPRFTEALHRQVAAAVQAAGAKISGLLGWKP